MNRRRFVEDAAKAAAIWAMGSGGLACVGLHYTQATASGNRLRLPARALEPQGFAVVEVPGFALPLYIERQRDGRYTAVSTRCMHRGCQVEPFAGRLVCPCHGSEYAGDGTLLAGPAMLSLKRFPVTVEGEFIVIDISGGEP